MEKFELPAELPTGLDGLTVLRTDAQAYLAYLVDEFDKGNTEGIEPTAIDETLAALDTLSSAIAEASTDDADHAAEVSAAVERARAAAAAAADTDTSETEEVEEIEGEVVEDKELVGVGAGAGGGTSTGASTKRPVSFTGKGPQLDEKDIEDKSEDTAPSWIVAHGAPGFDTSKIGTKVGFREMGLALDSVTKGHGVGRLTGRANGPKMRQEVARMSRGLKEVMTDRELVEAITAATTFLPNGDRVSTQSLTAAGGWCAPSEQIYTFCDIPEAGDLISLPEIAINRGGLRWPVEPDLTSLFESFEFFFTEPQLEAVDGNGDPTAIKHCVEIPCPDQFEELRLNAVGYCVEAGILQRQGWPESIEYVLRALTQEHLRAMSRRTILDMWNGGGTAKVFAANLQVGGTSSVLNSLDLMATNLRLQKGYNSTYPIEIVAPVWLFAALRADMAMMEGIDTKYVTDGVIKQWLTARNITGQFVADWQTRDVSLPGHLDTVRWPGHVDIMMYPAGTWFRHLSNIIEVGVLYPKEQLQINRYTEFFTEDAIAVGKRCDRSVNLRIPLPISGGYGAPVTITYTDTTVDQGAPISGAPVDGGQEGLPAAKTLAITGTPTGGNLVLDYEGDDITIAYNSTNTQAKTAIVNAAKDLGADDVTVTGGPLPGTALVITTPHANSLTIQSKALTGGTSPDATLV